MLSARAGEEARIEGLDAGADDYLVKPFSARELLARVDAHDWRRARLRREALHERSARPRAAQGSAIARDADRVGQTLAAELDLQNDCRRR